MATANRTKIKMTGYAHIVRTPGVLGGEARIDGLRIRVRDIAAARDLGGNSPEEIASTVYPDLTMAQVYAALTYFEDHRTEMDDATRREAGLIRKFRKKHAAIAHDRGRSRARGKSC